ncbi:arylsulfatase [Flammeovirga sp. EKP202]|uniref:arylsulfatase n=1 Tax=Flammeovirga sp. EKP202 TaxID=2770592 RepID=UPI00165EF7A8|nr:arylsulfatase [Flammeovirga sp. EKP202]MBD0400106.1 arylsulfatase [Flammeovirga sp. EKP202]
MSLKNLPLTVIFFLGIIYQSVGQEVLPFPKQKSKSKAGLTIKNSVYQPTPKEKHLSDDAPNILIILIDDAGPATASTYGGEINTPTLSRVANMGVSYNRFHSTAMCSPTRASLLTGRNHTSVGNGQIAELANDWDGYTGEIPKTSATVAEVLKNYGYNTSAFGKWHNTDPLVTTNKGPFDKWPMGYGFEYFYGFLGGEASQYEPQMIRNTTFVEHPETSGGNDYYHMTDDLADDAIKWLRDQNAFSPDKPFLMYWAPGAVHGPHHVNKKWADKYKGKFDDGWDAYRERVFKNQKELGWIPENATLTDRDTTLAGWDEIPEEQKDFQRRLMEVFAGFTEHTDYNVGRIIDELEALEKLDNTLIFYIWGDNGSSSEGQNGTISELLAQNSIATNIEQHIETLDKLGGLEVLGSNKTDNMYHAGWAWAGSTPYKGTKLLASHFGGTRQPMAVAWPEKIKVDKKPHSQFHHVNDITPTIYEVVGITPPNEVNGFPQDDIDGVSMAYSFNDADAKGQLKTQFFDIMGSRGVYSDGWFACTFGPRTPWVPGVPKGIGTWSPENDQWELYNLNEDWTQSNDLSKVNPHKLQLMKDLFLVEAAKNDDLPIGGALWSILYHPEDAPRSPYKEWSFKGIVERMPEFSAPKLGTISNKVTLNVTTQKNSDGVLYSLGGFSGGLSVYMINGYIYYEYNLFEIDRTIIKSKTKLPVGDVKIEVISKMTQNKARAPMSISILVNGKEISKGTVPVTAPLAFTANDCLDFGSDKGSPVSENYFDKAPYNFTGDFKEAKIIYTLED